MSTNAPAGWYSDPNAPGTERLWDGESWTAMSRPVAASAPPAPEPTAVMPVGAHLSQAGPPTVTPWYQRPAVLVGGGVLGALVLVGAVSGGDSSDDTKQTASAPAPTETVTIEAAAEDLPTATPTPTPEPKEPKPSKTPKAQVGSQPEAGGNTFTMPDEAGKNLQAAQDDLQAVSGNPFYVSFSEDLSGEDRFQMMDSNWTVCDQNIPPGTPVGLKDEVTFYVVYFDESCP